MAWKRIKTAEQKEADRVRSARWRNAHCNDSEWRTKEAHRAHENRKIACPMTPSKLAAYRERKNRNLRAFRDRKRMKATNATAQQASKRHSTRLDGATPIVQGLSPRHRQGTMGTAVTPESPKMIVRLPFSKQPRVRQLRRALDVKQKEVDDLKRALQKATSKAVSPPPLPSPERAALDILESFNMTPRDERVRALLPLTETASRVRKAPTTVKKALFVKKGAKRGYTKILSKTIGLSRKYIFNTKKTTYMRASIARSQRLLVVDFLKQPENSYELPSKKDQVRGAGIFGLTDTLQNLHCKFSVKYPAIKISLPVFCRARPHYIRLIKYTQRRQCLCQRHANVALMVEAVKVLPQSPDLLVQMSNEEIGIKLKGLSIKEIKYKNWQPQEVTHNGKIYKQIKLIQVVESHSNFSNKFINGMQEFRDHCHRITAQFLQVKTIKQKMEQDTEVTVQMDYAENYACRYQDEISAVYYNQNQVTIHPMVVNQMKDGGLAATSYVGVTGVNNHSAPTTYAFIKALLTELKDRTPNLATVHFITDSPLSQYRNRTICAIVARFMPLFKVQASWTWLEAGHGKGPCDGAGGSIKKKADNMVKAGRIITSSQQFCQAIATTQTAMTILEVTPQMIQDCKEEINTWTVPPVNGIKSAHALVPGPVLNIRSTSCFYDCCYEKGGNFHPTCPGWEKTKILVEQRDETEMEEQSEERELVEQIEETEMEEQTGEQEFVEQRKETQIVEDSEEREVVEQRKKKELMEKRDSNLIVGNYVAVTYGRRWYIGKISNVDAEMYDVSYMTPSRGKWKWGRRDQGMVAKEDILMQVSTPQPVGALWDIPNSETQIIRAKFGH